MALVSTKKNESLRDNKKTMEKSVNDVISPVKNN